MRKGLCAVLVLILILFAGCKEKSTLQTVNNFECSAFANFYGEDYEIGIVSLKSIVTAEIISPKSLKGLKYTVSDKKIEAEYLGVRSEGEKGGFGGLCVFISEILLLTQNANLEKSKSEYIFQETTEYGKVTVVFSQSGLPVKLNCDGGEVYAEFRNIKITEG